MRLESRPSLDRPLLIGAFGGWADGAEAATTAAGYLRDRWTAQRIGGIDAEEFFDFQIHRPHVRLEEGTYRRIDWPANDLLYARAGERDMLIFIGTEPNLRWRTFAETIVETAKEFGTELLVTLGAFLADVPHTHDPPVAGTSSNPELVSRFGLNPSRYEGPTGIVGVLHETAARGGLDSLSLWSAAPHYVQAAPNPLAALALLERLRDLLGLPIQTDTLARAAEAWQRRVTGLVAEDPDLQAYVRRLESLFEEREDPGIIPSGDELAGELERFLREQRERDEGERP